MKGEGWRFLSIIGCIVAFPNPKTTPILFGWRWSVLQCEMRSKTQNPRLTLCVVRAIKRATRKQTTETHQHISEREDLSLQLLPNMTDKVISRKKSTYSAIWFSILFQRKTWIEKQSTGHAQSRLLPDVESHDSSGFISQAHRFGVYFRFKSIPCTNKAIQCYRNHGNFLWWWQTTVSDHHSDLLRQR